MRANVDGVHVGPLGLKLLEKNYPGAKAAYHRLRNRRQEQLIARLSMDIKRVKNNKKPKYFTHWQLPELEAKLRDVKNGKLS